MLRFVLGCVLSLSLAFSASANNLQISNVVLSSATTLTFDMSWENSWRVTSAPANYDAVWIFVKRRDCASNRWYHTNLSTTSSDHTAAATLDAVAVGDAKGVYYRRASAGVGNITTTSCTIKLSGVPAGEYDYQVFGVEMVFIPQGSFYLGDGSSATGSTGSFYSPLTNAPFQVTGPGALTITTTAAAGNIWANNGTTSLPGAGTGLAAAYPKGYNDFYCMKYEISQQQYADFLNCLAPDQAANRWVVTAANRNTITGTWPSFVASAPDRANNSMNWSDLAAYLDWAALSPMTEFEFEKVCRGPIFPVLGEYAWSTTTITDANTVVNDGLNNEGASDAVAGGSGLANFSNSGITGPLRCGFAAKSATSRYEAGASYYGVMEMSGNVNERVVNIYDANGRAFTGLNGDGEISQTPTPGFADVSLWPSDAIAGFGQRGGNWADATAAPLRISDRSVVVTATTTRQVYLGGRGVRR